MIYVQFSQINEVTKQKQVIQAISMLLLVQAEVVNAFRFNIHDYEKHTDSSSLIHNIFIRRNSILYSKL